MPTREPDHGFSGLLDDLCVPSSGVLYVQSSADWIQRAGFEVSDALAALRRRVGATGTLVMPAYPFVGSHRDYLGSRPVYDVSRSPALVGLLPEVFRRSKHVVRSLDPDFCVAAEGAGAAGIAGGEPSDSDPFGAGSCYQRLLDRRAVILGLGVSLNTNSFIHLIDSRAAGGYPSPVYEEQSFPATVIDASGREREVFRQALRPEFQQLTSPAASLDAMRPGDDLFTTREVNGARFFTLDLAGWSSWCLAHARQQAAVRAWPCWLARLAGGSAVRG